MKTNFPGACTEFSNGARGAELGTPQNFEVLVLWASCEISATELDRTIWLMSIGDYIRFAFSNQISAFRPFFIFYEVVFFKQIRLNSKKTLRLFDGEKVANSEG